jgi:hypothetical protein
MRILVGIPTARRRIILSEVLSELSAQSRLPDRLALCPTSPDDIPHELLERLPFPTTIVHGSEGASGQRNGILRCSADYDMLIFFDDDFFPERSYIANAERLFVADNSIVLATGNLLEDGIHGVGLTPEYARARLAGASVSSDGVLLPYYGAYGCNMVVRLAPVRDHRLEFDEALPLYSWQEDIDFSRQLAPYGKIVRADALTGIHLGVKNGRTSGIRFGYSQIANPLYLIRKGTMSLRFGGRTMARNFASNIVHLPRPEPHVDRLGRLKGNFLALSDLIRGRLHPTRILEIEQ